ncbi:MAG: Fe-S protein assembly co-chaperone HscB [Polyangiaceae bacterium]
MADPFETLGVTPRFGLGLAELEERHRALSRALHPDRYAGAPAAERRMALGRAIEVNEALRVLKDPVRRAEALLSRAGVPTGEDREPKASPALLMEMMEAREALADAVRAKDAAQVEDLAKEMRAREAKLLGALGEVLDAPAPQAPRALALLGELRYTRRFLDEVSAFEEALAG